jgi:hypothetical protein
MVSVFIMSFEVESKKHVAKGRVNFFYSGLPSLKGRSNGILEWEMGTP